MTYEFIPFGTIGTILGVMFYFMISLNRKLKELSFDYEITVKLCEHLQRRINLLEQENEIIEFYEIVDEKSPTERRDFIEGLKLTNLRLSNEYIERIKEFGEK